MSFLDRIREQCQRNREAKEGPQPPAGGFQFITITEAGEERRFDTFQAQADCWCERYLGADTKYAYPGPTGEDNQGSPKQGASDVGSVTEG